MTGYYSELVMVRLCRTQSNIRRNEENIKKKPNNATPSTRSANKNMVCYIAGLKKKMLKTTCAITSARYDKKKYL